MLIFATASEVRTSRGQGSPAGGAGLCGDRQPVARIGGEPGGRGAWDFTGTGTPGSRRRRPASLDPPRAGWVLPELADVGHRQHGLTSLVGGGQVHPRGQAPVVITGRVIEDLAHLPAARKLLDDQQSWAARGR